MTRKGKYLVLDELSQEVARRCLVVGGQFSAFFEMAIALVTQEEISWGAIRTDAGQTIGWVLCGKNFE